MTNASSAPTSSFSQLLFIVLAAITLVAVPGRAELPGSQPDPAAYDFPH